MARTQFTEEEMQQFMIEKELSYEGRILAEQADKIIDECIMIPLSSCGVCSEKITELTNELDSIIKEFEQKVRDNDMWQVGPGDTGLNIHTLLVKAYKRASNTLKTKLSVMEDMNAWLNYQKQKNAQN
jgi:hypothetical protein